MECTFVSVSPQSDFPIQNLPFGVYSVKEEPARVGVAIGDYVLDLPALSELGLFAHIDGLENSHEVFSKGYLNDFMALGRPVWRAVRRQLQEFLSDDSHPVRRQADKALVCVELSK
ncbi:hypothetical protein H4S07_004388, partial [Coemansia furcata]